MSRESPSVGWREVYREMGVSTPDEREEDDDER